MRVERMKDNEKLESMRLLFPKYIREYITLSSDHLTSTTVLSYLLDIQDFMEWLIVSYYPEKKAIAEITLADLEELDEMDISHYRSHLKHRPIPQNTDKRYYKTANTERTVNRKISALRSLFTFLHTRRDRSGKPYLSKDVMENVKVRQIQVSAKAKAEKLKASIIRDNEIGDLIDFIMNRYGETPGVSDMQKRFWRHNRHRDTAIFLLMLTSGMRVGELTSLRLGDINIGERTAIVERKREKEDVVPFSLQTAEYLEKYLELRSSYYKAEQLSNAPLFVTRYKGSANIMSKNAVQKMIMKYAQVYGRPNLTAHILRHSFGTNVFNKTKNIRGVQELLGHSSSVTTEVYTHIFDDDKVNIIDEVFK